MRLIGDPWRAAMDAGVLIAAAVCPHPPLLIPEVASGAADELEELRAACQKAVRRLVAAAPDVLVIVGGAPQTCDYGVDVMGSLRPYGLDVTVGTGGRMLPLSLTVGRWLLDRMLPASRDSTGAGPGRFSYQGIAENAPAEACLRVGADLAAQADRVAFLVMGDGSARRSEKAPGYLDPRAADFDAGVARALAAGDAAWLAGLDPGLAAELMAAGRAPWQVLAGAASAASGRAEAPPAQGRKEPHKKRREERGAVRYDAELLADEAPYGVGYLVASWALEH